MRAQQSLHRIQKVLEDANVKLGNVLTDVFGASGQLILKALLEGKSGPSEMAELARGTARKKIPALVDALQAHRMSDHHRTMIQFSVEHLQFLEQQLQAIDAEILKKINESSLEEVFRLLQTNFRCSAGFGCHDTCVNRPGS